MAQTGRKVVIIGGVAGGASAAARLRRLDEDAQIVIIERTGFVSYANCGLPYYVGGIITDKSKLILQTPQHFMERFNVEVRVREEATRIDREAKAITVHRLADGSEYVEPYDVLVLSPGAYPFIPCTPGANNPCILTLRTVEDTLAMRQLITERKPGRAVVVGGGFIGLEVAENLVGLGIPTTLLQRSAHVLRQLDLDMACLVHGYLREQGLDLRLNTPVARYERRDKGEGMRVVTKAGEEIDADLVFMGTGVLPETALAKDAGLALGVKGAIVVDEHMRTSDPSIYAVGDAVEVRNSVSGLRVNVPLAGPANKQGRIAANSICGIDDAYWGSQGSSVVKLFGMTVGATGLTEADAKVAGMKAACVILRPSSHATYYPNAKAMDLKVVYEPASGRILGAQCVGFGGVDKRIDVLATAIHSGDTSADLEDLDLAYAPPYSSAKDPVNMAGFIIENLRSGLVKQFSWDEVAGLARDGSVTLIDVRTPGEYAFGHIDGFVNEPLDGLRARLDEIPVDRPVYITCQVGLRGYIACRLLTGHGYDCRNLAGGYGFYSRVVEGAKSRAEAARGCGAEKA